MIPKGILIITWLFYFSFPTFSQDLGIEFFHLGEEEGLFNDSFNSFITKDRQGFVWISSMQDCYRFDGQNLKHYIISKTGEFGEMIQSSFFEDKNGDLWFTTYDALHRYDRTNDDFKSIRLKKDANDIDIGYHAFYFDMEGGNLWLKAGEDIWIFNTKDKKYRSVFQDNFGKRFCVYKTANGKVDKIYSFPWKNKLGFSIWSEKNGLWKEKYFGEGLLKNAEISNGLIENDSTIWLISDKGLIKFVHKKQKLTEVFSPKLNESPLLINGVFIKDNLLFLIYKNNGIWSFDTKNNLFVKNWNNFIEKKNNLKEENSSDLYLDHDGTLWVTKDKGVDYGKIVPRNYRNPFEQISVEDRIIKNMRIKG